MTNFPLSACPASSVFCTIFRHFGTDRWYRWKRILKHVGWHALLIFYWGSAICTSSVDNTKKLVWPMQLHRFTPGALRWCECTSPNALITQTQVNRNSRVATKIDVPICRSWTRVLVLKEMPQLLKQIGGLRLARDAQLLPRGFHGSWKIFIITNTPRPPGQSLASSEANRQPTQHHLKPARLLLHSLFLFVFHFFRLICHVFSTKFPFFCMKTLCQFRFHFPFCHLNKLSFFQHISY